MSTPNITAISVYIEIDGRLCLAPIGPEHSTMFLGMLPAFQAGERKDAHLIAMPPDVTQCVYNAGRALSRQIANAQANSASKKHRNEKTEPH